ncbi:D-sedoheptulose 7-phosphate isomerase [Maridesulfovibrio salexigens]|uniref:Phosphoheptose isomerase n=1 Tax=Maridesulfovibrio salexigens (strain ATCC 14822 / DSM 2638 / NCIMB 8403 / VKM B-1763) TaxID=526222 RepID=GMHA_MARSD|nr:D-sedoheptulose 7-phosphate isomerase [Maridesulfovibrio salexigens]C6C0L8.1 RecName: Full=Phosphoheptose isomerase; AltName: Full=Sedoheptulose 7-phosphate isomerase [Maridesulfovibrio salexigens DSM 2638]ACS79152.1 phosphoheptose isomerase [Maridesulfovibrio salexigens DSM 2638]
MSQTALQKVVEHARAGLEVRESFFEQYSQLVVDVSKALAVRLALGSKILFCGNGGSAADCQHLAAELVNRFKLERPPLPGIALTTDSSILTAIGNDYSYEMVFEKQVQALGQPGDVLVGISTSGTSPNVISALKEAKRKGMVTIGMTGISAGEMLPICDHIISVPSKDTAVIQEVHIAVGHLFCHLIDHFLFEAVGELEPYLSGE